MKRQIPEVEKNQVRQQQQDKEVYYGAVSFP